MEQILRLLANADSAAVIDDIAARPDALAAAKSLHEAMRHCYWKQKNLAGAVVLARIGVHHALAAAAAAEPAFNLKSVAKAMSYDLASFTWNGWDEPGIAITPSDLAVGLDAAKANLRLAHELNKGDLPLSRACWMLAGHCLATGTLDQAMALYQRAAEHAVAAGSKADELLCHGFERLVDLIRAPQDVAIRRAIDDIQHQLKPQDDGDMFVQQIDTAARVFGVALH